MKLSKSEIANERASKYQREALDAGCKKMGFIASIDLQKKIDAVMLKRGIKQKKELIEMLINEAYML